MKDTTNTITKKFLEKFKDFKPSPMLRAALNGDSCTAIASQTAKALDADMKERGATHFTMADIRRVQRKMFKGS